MKWGKEKFDGVELNTDEPPMVFKAQLFALTGVQPARQKVMVKGGTLKVEICSSIFVFLSDLKSSDHHCSVPPEALSSCGLNCLRFSDTAV